MIIFTTVSVLLHFKNNISNDIMIGKIYLVLKFVMFHSLLQVFAYPLVSGDLTTIITKNGDYNCETFNHFLFYSSLEKQNSFINLFGIDFLEIRFVLGGRSFTTFFKHLFFLEAFIMQKKKISFTINFSSYNYYVLNCRNNYLIASRSLLYF